MAPKKNLYKVKHGRCVVLMNDKKVGRNWAYGGDIIDLSHPMLVEDMGGEMHKLTKLDKLPKGAKVKDDYPTFYVRRMKFYDRKALARAAQIGDIDVDGPNEELEARNVELESENAKLRAELEELKSQKV